MVKPREIKIIDLFAGPGGLGEGFSAFSPESSELAPFRIRLSAEMDPVARNTLRLRSFFRLAQRKGKVPQSYYDYVAGNHDQPFDDDTATLWEASGEEACCVTLGTSDGDREVDEKLDDLLSDEDRWVLVGGPPCQAYSLVGRARNRGIQGYVADEDKRHFLYQDYLRIIARKRPAVFVMENVKGILSSRIDGELIFHTILRDLAQPGKTIKEAGADPELKYRLYSLTTGGCFDHESNIKDFDPRHFVVESERFGVPQRRHRVFVLGVREDIERIPDTLAPANENVSCKTAIGDLPRLRSGLSKETDAYDHWQDVIAEEVRKMVAGIKARNFNEVADSVQAATGKIKHRNSGLDRHAKDKPYDPNFSVSMPEDLVKWHSDVRLKNNLNHETRGHIAGDLGRYIFSACYAGVKEGSPKAKDFPDSLAPDHANWKSGKFADRFRVQLADQPSTTITSHISKDGHYFIHYDATQCRSLTVREAARLQTFPDNYFFEGNRTQQYVQVGNAVPPYLARQIAEVVWNILK